MGVLYFGYRLALSPIRALRALGGSSVWSTVFSDQMRMLVEVSIEMRPSSLTPFHQIIAVHYLLWRHVLRFDSIFQVQPGIDSLGESDGVARATGPLVSMLIQEVVSLNVSVIILSWQLRVWNFVSMVVIFLPLLRKLQGFDKVGIVCVSEWLLILILLDISKHVSDFRVVLEQCGVLKDKLVVANLPFAIP